MKKLFPFSLWVAVCLGAVSNVVDATSQLTFADTWKDTGAFNVNFGASVKTTGSFSTTISLPLNGVDLSEADVNSMVSLSIGPVGNTATVISDTLGDVAYNPGHNTATYPITGTDASGNPINVGTVKVTWTSTAITVSGTASADVLGLEQLFTMDSSGVATNAPISGFAEVVLTMDASDNGGGVFNYDNPNVPVKGSDKETEYNPPDGSGPYPLETGSVTGTGDFTPPKLAITTPASGFKVYDVDTSINLVGTASDSELVTNIECIVNGDYGNPIFVDQESSFPTNAVDWTAEVDLSVYGQVGTNIITVIAQDLSGNQSSVSRTYYWIETNVVQVSVNPVGAGTTSGLKNGQVLTVGSAYSVKAMPASKNWIFSQWTDGNGDVLSSNANFEYFDESGTPTTSLIANFVPNPFTNTTLAGTYTGLYYDNINGPTVHNTGYITITLTETGAFSGKFYNADYSKTTLTLSGQMSESPDGLRATAETPVLKLSTGNSVQVILQVTTDPVLTDAGAGQLGGLVYRGIASDTNTDVAEIQGELTYYNTNIPTGVYNLAITNAPADPSQGPGGFSYGTATVSNKKGSAGAVTLVLNLADGTTPAITFNSALARDGTCPIYAALYGGNAAFIGWLQFATDGSGVILPSTLNWFTGFDYTSSVYTNGIDEQPTLFGGLYVPPKSGTDVFGNSSLTFEVDPGYSGFNLPDELDIPLTFNPNSTFTIPNNANKLSVKFTSSTGALSGTFSDSAISKNAAAYKGVVVNGVGYGFYVAGNKETGPVEIIDPPVAYGGGGGDDYEGASATMILAPEPPIIGITGGPPLPP